MSVEARPVPLTRLRRQSVFDRVEVDVITMTKPVGFISYTVFPVTRLPHTQIAVSRSISGHRQVATPGRHEALCKQAFDVRLRAPENILGGEPEK